jgi:hypothetical protein
MHQIGILEYIGYAVSGAFVTASVAFAAIKASARKDKAEGQTGGFVAGI